MPSVMPRFPSRIMLDMNFVTMRSAYFGSDSTSLRLTSPLRGMRMQPRPPDGRDTGRLARARTSGAQPSGLLGSLGSVLRAALATVLDADGVERPADDVVADARKVLHAATPDEHHRVLLEVVADAGDVGRDLDAVRQPDAGDLAERRVRLLRGGRVDARADTALLGRSLQRGRLALGALPVTALLDELVDGGHRARSVRLHVRRKKGTDPSRCRLASCQPFDPPGTHQATASGVDSPSGSPSSSSAGSSVTASMLLYLPTPVPAGISRPMMTFSLRPTRRSTLPLMAASVRTLVVSWKDAAEMKLSVDRLAFVMPRSSGSATAGCPPPPRTRWFSSSKRHFSTWSPIRNSVSPTSLMRTRRSIWRTITSMCLSLMRTPCSR